MGATVDMNHMAKSLGAQRRGKITTKGGYFGALDLAAEVSARFRVPEKGGRATDPAWTEQRLVRLSQQTFQRLEKLTKRTKVSPMQAGALLLEKAVDQAVKE
ncbi:MAG: hypothetical protein HOP18_05975 [Deltaproteobacteria bacterium]|nr:hypothetical protein [Deltaproteobacteria bacterium]